MKWFFVFALIGLFTIRLTLASDYPSVREIESGLGYAPGVQIPRDIPARGKGWHVYYVGAKSVGNGEYDVRIKLR